MIYFLYGPDNLSSRRKLKEIIRESQKVRANGLNLVSLDFSRDSFEEFLEKAESVSLFSPKKLLILKNVFSNDNVGRNFQRFFKEKPNLFRNDILIFFETEEVAKETSFFHWLLKNSVSQEFRWPSRSKLAALIQKTTKEQGAEISLSAAGKLAEIFSNDLWALDNEIKKLIALKKNQIIEARDLEALEAPAMEANIFKTIEAIAAQNRVQALKLLDSHLEQGDSPAYLLSMIAYQLRNLVLTRQLLEKKTSVQTMIQLTGLKPFVFNKCLSQAQSFNFSRLKQVFHQLLETDQKIKTGRLSPRQGLESLVLSV